jgi:hypothetical protein
MRFDRRNKLERLGFDSEWLDNVYKYFTPRKIGKYKMVITDIEHLDEDPRDGIPVETTCFDNAEDLSVIHHFFEGNAYVLTVTETGEQIGEGIIDGAPFEECSYHETGEYEHHNWQWTTYTLDEIISNNPGAQSYYRRIESNYHKKVKENRELKEENKILKAKVAELQANMNLEV